MAKPSVVTDQGSTADIAADKWIPFLDAFTRENRGAHAVLEVLGEEVGRQVATEDRVFDGISADTKDGERSVWITFASTTVADNFTHGVQRVTAIRVRPATVHFGAAVQVEAGDGTTTLLILSLPEEYALPPAGSGENRQTL